MPKLYAIQWRVKFPSTFIIFHLWFTTNRILFIYSQLIMLLTEYLALPLKLPHPGTDEVTAENMYLLLICEQMLFETTNHRFRYLHVPLSVSSLLLSCLHCHFHVVALYFHVIGVQLLIPCFT